jgi:hypothetical protein
MVVLGHPGEIPFRADHRDGTIMGLGKRRGNDPCARRMGAITHHADHRSNRPSSKSSIAKRQTQQTRCLRKSPLHQYFPQGPGGVDQPPLIPLALIDKCRARDVPHRRRFNIYTPPLSCSFPFTSRSPTTMDEADLAALIEVGNRLCVSFSPHVKSPV